MAGLADLLNIQNLTGVPQDSYSAPNSVNEIAQLIASLSNNGAPVTNAGSNYNTDQYSNWAGGMGMPLQNSGTGIKDLMQIQLGAKQPVQPNLASNILAGRFEEPAAPAGVSSGDEVGGMMDFGGGPSYGDYASAISEAYHGGAGDAQKIANAGLKDRLSILAAMGKGNGSFQAAQMGGATGGLIHQLMADNPNYNGTGKPMTFTQGAQAIQTGFRQNMLLGDDNQLNVIPGASDAVKQINQSKATGTTLGKGFGEDITSYRRQAATYPRLQEVTAKLGELATNATYTAIGQAAANGLRQAGQEVPAGMVDRVAYQAVVRNEILPLLRQTFGAQFTENEGLRLETTLGDPNLSPPEKQAALDAFIDSKFAQLKTQATAAGIPFDPSQFVQGSGSQPQTGNVAPISKVINGVTYVNQGGEWYHQ